MNALGQTQSSSVHPTPFAIGLVAVGAVGGYALSKKNRGWWTLGGAVGAIALGVGVAGQALFSGGGGYAR